MGLLGLALLAGIAIGLSFSFGKVDASENAPGTVGDPLVSKSYVDAQLNTQIEAKVSTYISQLDLSALIVSPSGTPTPTPPPTDVDSTGSTFQVLHLMPGDMLIGGESTELILRSGSATAIANTAGNGLADVTSGIDVGHEEEVELNHLLIVPRTDGRGLMIQTESYIMVKGYYEIRQ